MLKSNLLLLFCAFILAILPTHCTIPEIQDTTPPIVNLIYPVPGAVLSGNIIVTVQASDDREVSKIWYTLDGEILDRSSSPRADFQLDLTT
ncbi:MAG: Ig-like domain-containing protein, partial [Calditrichia bacterium]